jgi:hypothetical protein
MCSSSSVASSRSGLGESAVTLDIIFENLGLHLIPFQAFSQTCQEHWIEVRTGKAVRAKERRVQEIEHRPVPAPAIANPAAGPQRCRLDQMLCQFSGGLCLADGRYMFLVILCGDDFSQARRNSGSMLQRTPRAPDGGTTPRRRPVA